MRLGTVSVLAGAAVLAAAGLAAAKRGSMGPIETPQSIGVELVVSGVPLVEYNPEAEAGLKYMPLVSGMELARSQGFSSIPGVPMMKLTASDASNIEDSKSPDVASIDPQKMFNIFGESLYWSVPEDWTGGLLLTGKVEVEGGPIDVTDRALFETYMQTLRLAARQVVDSAKCEPFVTVTKEVPVSRPKWGKGVRKRKTSESVRVALPRRVTDGEELTKDGKQKKDPIAAEGTPLNFAVRRFNSQKDLDERFKLSDTLTWDNSYRGVAANVPNAADYDPHLYCLGGRPPADVSVAISTVVPLVSFGYAPPRGQRDLGEFLAFGGLRGWKDALAAARAAVDSIVDTGRPLRGPESLCQVDFVMRLPEVRSILVAIVYAAAVEVQVNAYGRAGLLEHFKKVASGNEAELAKDDDLRYAMESIASVGQSAEYGGDYVRWLYLFKTYLADLTRALPRTVRRALARSDAGTERDNAWARDLASAAAHEFNQRRVLLGTEKTPLKWGEVNKVNVISAHDYKADEKLAEAIKIRFKIAFTLGANVGVLLDEVKAKEFAPVDRVRSFGSKRLPLRLKDTAHVMLLVEQQQGRANELAEHFATLGVDESVSVANKLRWSNALNKLHTKLSDASTPFLPPCPKPDASGEDLHPCSNHPSFPQDFAARKKVEHVTDAIVKKFHVCMAPYSALAAIPGVEAATKSWDEETWPYYVSSCQRGKVPYVLFAPKKWEF